MPAPANKTVAVRREGDALVFSGALSRDVVSSLWHELLGNAAGVLDELHRLVASCGFVGAAHLGQVVRQMQASPLEQDALATLQSAIEDVLTSAWANGG